MLGHPARTKEGAPHARRLDGGAVFASAANTRELATVEGVAPPMHYHSLIIETGGRIARFREFVLFHSEYVYPEYLLAYQRLDARGQPVR